MLSDFLQEKYVQIGKEVHTFEEAIKKSMQPLLEDNAITENYVEKVINIYNETGPYIVITKHIALPHAPSEDGAKKLALGFMKLDVPIISGNTANDPVKFFFPLSAPDNKSHLEILSKLAELLGDEEFIKFLESVDSPENFIQYIKTKG
ncbi:PTS sugar transporter subunit IIA [Candidatus Enterococcus willemsii]|uniref:Ascorbate-specific PTS system EIIA component n=1 Tax=Candidatus Enterococcus willemsii TaxID=1857215 RepID=A0ABQ6Z194_9ENTE|nr:PTS sugar transporter subunit IIA [Enterococcus sp. CU12B]KAF1305134.1 PTS sugar transporter subunit IIB [Enterococcus sp. CU12B]